MQQIPAREFELELGLPQQLSNYRGVYMRWINCREFVFDENWANMIFTQK